jgi:uridine kinase
VNRDVQLRGIPLNAFINQYRTSVRPMFEEFIQPTKQVADIVFPYSQENSVAIAGLVGLILLRCRVLSNQSNSWICCLILTLWLGPLTLLTYFTLSL